MKLLPLLLLCLLAIAVNGQDSSIRWSFSLLLGANIGGPQASIRSHMVASHYDAAIDNWFFGNADYPIGTKLPALLLEADKKVRSRGAFQLVAGLAAGGKMTGYRSSGTGNSGLFASQEDPRLEVRHRLWQVGAGYVFLPGRSGTRLGVTPSLFCFSYRITDMFQPGFAGSSIVPGALLSARIPFIRRHSKFRIDLLFAATLAPSVTMEAAGQKKDQVSLTQGTAGLSFHRSR